MSESKYDIFFFIFSSFLSLPGGSITVLVVLSLGIFKNNNGVSPSGKAVGFEPIIR